MEEPEISNERLISEFNEAKFQIIRLHNIWVDVRTYREKGSLLKVKDILDSAQLELITDMTRLDQDKKDKDKYSDKFKNIDEKIISELKKHNRSEVYNQLKEKEALLRLLQQEAGKGGKLRDEEDDFM